MPAPVERAFVASPIASAGGRVITSPFQFYTTGEDHLRMTVVNALTGVVVKLRGRFVDTVGLITPFEHDHAPTTDRTATTSTLQLGIGAVLNVDVFAASGTPQTGQTFVIVQLVRGLGAAGIVLGTLLQGYVTSTQHLAWPGSPIQSSFDGPGAVRFVTGTNPAAGVEILEAVPTGARWRLVNFGAQLLTDATIVSRVPYLQIVLAGVNVALYPPAASIPQTFLQFCGWATGYTTFVVGGVTAQAMSIPTELLLPSAWQLRTVTESLQPGDNWSSPFMLVNEWLEVG